MLQLLGGYASDPRSPAIVMVTHHVEEIPLGFGNALILSDGGIVAQGALSEVLTSEKLTEAFGLPIELTEHNGRYSATSA